MRRTCKTLWERPWCECDLLTAIVKVNCSSLEERIFLVTIFQFVYVVNSYGDDFGHMPLALPEPVKTIGYIIKPLVTCTFADLASPFRLSLTQDLRSSRLTCCGQRHGVPSPNLSLTTGWSGQSNLSTTMLPRRLVIDDEKGFCKLIGQFGVAFGQSGFQNSCIRLLSHGETEKVSISLKTKYNPNHVLVVANDLWVCVLMPGISLFQSQQNWKGACLGTGVHWYEAQGRGSWVVAALSHRFGPGKFHKNSRKMSALRNACSRASTSMLVNRHLIICWKVYSWELVITKVQEIAFCLDRLKHLVMTTWLQNITFFVHRNVIKN